MERKKLRVQRPAGGAIRINNESLKRRGNQVGDGPYPVERNQFFYTYSDGSREVRDVDIDYDDYSSDTYENIKKNIADNIARLRKEKNLSCENIAEDVEVSRQYIAQIENGERNVSLEVLAKIAFSLGVSVEFLIKKNPFKPCNVYIDKLVAELKELEPKRQKVICAEIIERLWSEND
ncbi:MAG: helix-turn-helix transcriptional regulator [Ruminococcus sp.]|nr:helix-turn-helix transcriptional regulator [Ruminococcus sp.]